MPYDHTIFFDEVRHSLFGGHMNQGQVEGMDLILTLGAPLFIKDLGYCLATTKWETAHTMQPIEEYGKGKGKPYGVPDPETGQIYYGRGFVQLTHRSNYEWATEEFGIDFVNQPELALEPFNAAHIMFEGMKQGAYTGKKLSDYFTQTTSDSYNARRIVNGTDHAADIAHLYDLFLDALLKAEIKAPVPPAPRCPVCGQPLPAV